MVEPERRHLSERYELVRLIASGGMGQVWAGADTLLGRSVAIKVLRSEYTSDPTFLARFRAEAQHSAALSHPNIAAVFDYGETTSGHGEALAFLVMELVDGEPLSAMLHREQRLDAETTLSVLEQTAAALAEAHRVGLVHRDVKPGNILVCSDGAVKITDFGIAWSAGSAPLTRTGQVIGTPQYLSPEQAEGATATPASDVYALGLVGYECLAGHPAFDGDNAVAIALKQLREQPEPLPDDVPIAVRTVIGQALAKQPAARMPDGAAFADAIGDIRAGRMPRAVPVDGGASVAAEDPEVSSEQCRADAPGTAQFDLPVARSFRTAPPPPRRRAAAVLAPVVGLVVGAAAAAALFLALTDAPGDNPVAAAQTQEQETVTLVEADYLGLSVDDVARELSTLGLSVHRHAQVSDTAEPNAVLRVEPAGRALSRGDVVAVSFAVPSPAGQSAPSYGTDSGEVTEVGTSDVPAREPAAPPVSPTTAPPPVPPTALVPRSETSAAPSASPTTSTSPSTPASSSSGSTSSSSTPTSTAPSTARSTSTSAASVSRGSPGPSTGVPLPPA